MKFDPDDQSANYDGLYSFYEEMLHSRNKFREEQSDQAIWGSKENAGLVIRRPEFKGYV